MDVFSALSSPVRCVISPELCPGFLFFQGSVGSSPAAQPPCEVARIPTAWSCGCRCARSVSECVQPSAAFAGRRPTSTRFQSVIRLWTTYSVFRFSRLPVFAVAKRRRGAASPGRYRESLRLPGARGEAPPATPRRQTGGRAACGNLLTAETAGRGRLERAFSPFGSFLGDDLGRCPRLVWGRAFGSEETRLALDRGHSKSRVAIWS